MYSVSPGWAVSMGVIVVIWGRLRASLVGNRRWRRDGPPSARDRNQPARGARPAPLLLTFEIRLSIRQLSETGGPPEVLKVNTSSSAWARRGEFDTNSRKLRTEDSRAIGSRSILAAGPD